MPVRKSDSELRCNRNWQRKRRHKRKIIFVLWPRKRVKRGREVENPAHLALLAVIAVAAAVSPMLQLGPGPALLTKRRTLHESVSASVVSGDRMQSDNCVNHVWALSGESRRWLVSRTVTFQKRLLLV
jgi:hypothetical protein